MRRTRIPHFWRASLAAFLCLSTVLAATSAATAQPGVGRGGADVVAGTDGGADVVVRGSFAQVPTVTGVTGTSGGGAAGGGGAGGGSGGSIPPPTISTPFDGGVIVTDANTGTQTGVQIELSNGPNWCSGGAVMTCTPISPDVGMPVTPAFVDPVTVAMQAITAMQLEPPPMCMTPENGRDDRTGLVGLWSWFWICTDQISERTTGPVTRVATAGAVTVTATANLSSVLVNWGDRSTPQICIGAPFTPYTDVFVDLPSPTCSHFLERSSITEIDQKFHPSATSNWVVTWTAVTPAGAAGGVIPVPLTSRTAIRVGELQVLVTK